MIVPTVQHWEGKSVRFQVVFEKFQQVRFTDSMNAAIVAGLTAAGMAPDLLVGMGAVPWTFGMEGWSKAGKPRLIRSLIVSSPDLRFAEAMRAAKASDFRVTSSNGDVIDGRGASIWQDITTPEGDTDILINFLSPFVIKARKSEGGTHPFLESLPENDLHEALKTGLDRRAGRDLNLRISVDPLSLKTDGRRKHMVHYRRMANGKSLILPGYALPMRLQGAPEDLRFAYLAGLGSKTRAGNGCPVRMQ